MLIESVLTHWPKPSEHLPYETLIRLMNKYKPAGLIVCCVDGGGSAITAPDTIYLPAADFKARITGWAIVADQAGSIQFDIWKAAYPTVPTVSDTIITSNPPLLSSAQVNRSESITTGDWEIEIALNDVLAVNVVSSSTVQRVTLSIAIAREGQGDPV